MLYTDTRGIVIFVNRGVLQILGRSDSTALIGQPLHRALGIDAVTARSLLAVRRAGDRLRSASEDYMLIREGSLLCASEPAYDDRGTFIGMNVMLDAQEPQRSPSVQPQDESRDLLARYFAFQINMLEVLLERMAGPRIRMAFEKAITDTAGRQGWPIRLENFAVEGEGEPPVYACLLGEALAYGSSILNRRLVISEMRGAHQGSDSRQQELACQWGLADLFAESGQGAAADH